MRKVVGVKVAPGFVAAAKLVLGVITTYVFLCTKVGKRQNSFCCVN